MGMKMYKNNDEKSTTTRMGLEEEMFSPGGLVELRATKTTKVAINSKKMWSKEEQEQINKQILSNILSSGVKWEKRAMKRVPQIL